MRVTVLGGTGKIGRHVVDELLAAGHQVVALVRTPSKLSIQHPALTVLTGQLSDVDTIRAAVTGSDAVISALGPSLKPGAAGTALADGTHTVVTAMRQAGVRRFIGLATPSLPDPRDRPTLKAKILPVMAKVMFPNALTELRGMTAAVTASDLDWTIARITNPTDKPPTGTIRAGFLGVDPIGSAMSREDIAAFLVAQLTDDTYMHAALQLATETTADRPRYQLAQPSVGCGTFGQAQRPVAVGVEYFANNAGSTPTSDAMYSTAAAGTSSGYAGNRPSSS